MVVGLINNKTTWAFGIELQTLIVTSSFDLDVGIIINEFFTKHLAALRCQNSIQWIIYLLLLWRITNNYGKDPVKHDNTGPQTTQKTLAKLQELKLETLFHPSVHQSTQSGEYPDADPAHFQFFFNFVLLPAGYKLRFWSSSAKRFRQFSGSWLLQKVTRKCKSFKKVHCYWYSVCI